MMSLSDLCIDEVELLERGFTKMPGLVSMADLAEFEQVIGELCNAEIRTRGIKPHHADPFIDVMLADEEYRSYLFPLLRRFHVIERISANIGTKLAKTGFLSRHNYRAPLIWPYLRADLPHESTYELGFHQDIHSTESAKAWRIWLPLRDVDRHHGSMELVAGSHKHGQLEHTQDGPLRALIDEAAISEKHRVGIEARAGEAILFHPHILHRSVPNRSERVKFVILIQVQDGTELLGPNGDLASTSVV